MRGQTAQGQQAVWESEAMLFPVKDLFIYHITSLLQPILPTLRFLSRVFKLSPVQSSP